MAAVPLKNGNEGIYYWMVDHDFPEAICLSSEAIAYRDSLALPTGTGAESPK
jgi:hypothetical protein